MNQRIQSPLHHPVIAVMLLLCVSATSLQASQSTRAIDRLPGDRPAAWFPLGPGFTWTYVVRGVGEDSSREVSVLPVEQNRFGRAAFMVEGYFNGSEERHRLRLDPSGVVVEVGPDGREYPWYRFGSEVGESWVMHLATPGVGGCEDGVTLRLMSRQERVSVPAGDFHDVIRIDRETLLCADAGIVSEWFAPGVGLIRRVEQSIGGAVTSELVEADLGNRSWPFAGYETALHLSSSSFVNNLLPPVDPEGLPVVYGRFVVRSRRNGAPVLRFAGCRSIRMELRDPAGSLVRTVRADAGGCCDCDSLVEVDLAEEDLKVPFSFRLSDEQGQALPDGSYSLTAIVEALGAESLQPAARSRIEIQSVH